MEEKEIIKGLNKLGFEVLTFTILKTNFFSVSNNGVHKKLISKKDLLDILEIENNYMAKGDLKK